MARPRSAAQKAALRKAQLASARKRRGKGKGKLAAAHRRLDTNVPKATKRGKLARVGSHLRRNARGYATGALLVGYTAANMHSNYAKYKKARVSYAQRSNNASFAVGSDGVATRRKVIRSSKGAHIADRKLRRAIKKAGVRTRG